VGVASSECQWVEFAPVGKGSVLVNLEISALQKMGMLPIILKKNWPGRKNI
jgi:hypothetical protein